MRSITGQLLIGAASAPIRTAEAVLEETVNIVHDVLVSSRDVGLIAIDVVDRTGRWAFAHWSRLSDTVADFISDNLHWIANLFARRFGHEFESSEQWRAFTRAALVGSVPCAVLVICDLIAPGSAAWAGFAAAGLLGVDLAARKKALEEAKLALSAPGFVERAQAHGLSAETVEWLQTRAI